METGALCESIGLGGGGKKYVSSEQTLLCLEGLALLIRRGFEAVGCPEHEVSLRRLDCGARSRGASSQI